MTEIPNTARAPNRASGSTPVQDISVERETPNIAKLRVVPEFLSLIDDLDENTIVGGPHVLPQHIEIDPQMTPTREFAFEEFCINAGIDMNRGANADRITDVPHKGQTWRNFHTNTCYTITGHKDDLVRYRYFGGNESSCSLKGFLKNFKQVIPNPNINPLAGFINDSLCKQSPIAVFHDPRDGIIVPAIDIDGDRIKGVVALVEEKNTSGHMRIAGMLTWPILYVEEEMRGAGLGTALVMVSFLQDRELPDWYDEVPEYSPAGIAAVRKALPGLKEISAALQAGAELPAVARNLGLSITVDDLAPCP